ncbi:hypothetical protein K7X08_017788 [Anisodus acutangulus]|uniref:C2H2-type domain-containing protein n=1 Tax=Anisodus acutangulus TaxID=402998 RepID=A0A9Q1R8J4_9SOLA|nr:hypothetical protein K7X08_017788 [Anisodus acutangulus]
MQAQNRQGRWIYECIHCRKPFLTSQAIAGHTKRHLKHGWVKGTRQRKIFVPYPNYQVQQQGSGTDSSIPHQQQQVESDDSTNVHQVGAQNVENTADPASSSKRSRVREHHFGVRDQKILARLIGHLTKEEKDVIMRLVESARELAKQSSPEVEVIPNNDSEAAPVIGNTNKDVVKIEDSDGESISITF